MELREEKEKQLEEVYQRNLQYHECFTKEKGLELYGMCKKCEVYVGDEHDYTECRDKPCFKNWLALEYFEWINSYGFGSRY